MRLPSIRTTPGNDNPLVRTVEALVCCNVEYDMQTYGDLEAREVGGGMVCLSCPKCHKDMAVVS